MKTEYAASIAKDFDADALAQIADACRRRAAWCKDEAHRRRDSPELWSLEDVKDLLHDADVFETTGRQIEKLIEA